MTKWIWVDARTPSLAGRVEAGGGSLILDRGDGRHLWGFRAPRGGAEPAARLFVSSALTAVAAVPSGVKFVNVVGEGMLAALIRLALANRSQSDSASAIIDTTGNPELIGRATADLPRRGTLVLAAPAGAEHAMMRTYADIHVRALSIVGVRWSEPGGETPRRLVEFALENLVSLDVPTVPSQGLWYRLEER